MDNELKEIKGQLEVIASPMYNQPTNKGKFMAVVKLIVNANNHAEAGDTISGLLSENGVDLVFDWTYIEQPKGVSLNEQTYNEGDLDKV